MTHTISLLKTAMFPLRHDSTEDTRRQAKKARKAVVKGTAGLLPAIFGSICANAYRLIKASTLNREASDLNRIEFKILNIENSLKSYHDFIDSMNQEIDKLLKHSDDYQKRFNSSKHFAIQTKLVKIARLKKLLKEQREEKQDLISETGLYFENTEIMSLETQIQELETEVEEIQQSIQDEFKISKDYPKLQNYISLRTEKEKQIRWLNGKLDNAKQKRQEILKKRKFVTLFEKNLTLEGIQRNVLQAISKTTLRRDQLQLPVQSQIALLKGT